MRSLRWTAVALAIIGCSETTEGGAYYGPLQVVPEQDGFPHVVANADTPEVTVVVNHTADSRYRASLDGCQFEFDRDENGRGLLVSGRCSCPGTDQPQRIGVHDIELRASILSFRLLATDGNASGCRYQFRGRRAD